MTYRSALYEMRWDALGKSIPGQFHSGTDPGMWADERIGSNYLSTAS